jgi:hypothetical protein
VALEFGSPPINTNTKSSFGCSYSYLNDRLSIRIFSEEKKIWTSPPMNQRVSKVIRSSILHGNHHSHVMGYFRLQEMTSSGEFKLRTQQCKSIFKEFALVNHRAKK